MNVGARERVHMAADWPFPLLGSPQGFNFDTRDFNTGTPFYDVTTGHFTPNVPGYWNVYVRSWMQADPVPAACSNGHVIYIHSSAMNGGAGGWASVGVDDFPYVPIGSQPCAGPQTSDAVYCNGTGDFISFCAMFDASMPSGTSLTGAKLLGGYEHTFATFTYLGPS